MNSNSSAVQTKLEPLSALEEKLSGYSFAPRFEERGLVSALGDGIVRIEGLPSAAMDEIVDFADGSQALVFELTASDVGAILLSQGERLAAGNAARLSGKSLSIGTGDALLGRVIDPLGRSLDGLALPEPVTRRNLEMPSPPVLKRDFVNSPLYSGNKIVDSLIPIGKGQRQLVIGDNGTGKSSFALDMVINQRGKNIRCVYVLIGQKRRAVVEAIEILRRHNALEYTTLLVAEASAMPGLKYLAPFAGCALAEHWMNSGMDTLVVYDDLATHARSYRELSLLLRRPPGREAYPGDIFHLHARLLERSTCLAASHGGGSMTALPIVETEQGEMTSYIPTNLISITDGQIYLDSDLFARGFLPAIDVTRSVSRIGGKAQHPNIRSEAGRMKLDYLTFLELEVFTRFGSRLDAGMEEKIRRGRVLRELLKQERFSPCAIEFQLAWMIAYNEKMFDHIVNGDLKKTLSGLARAVESSGLAIFSSRDEWLAMLKSFFAQ